MLAGHAADLLDRMFETERALMALNAGELGVLRLAWNWFRWDHLPLLRSVSRMRELSARDRLRKAELLGCFAGPGAWLSERRVGRTPS